MNGGPSGKEGEIIRFRLVGPSRAYDPRKQAIRPDLADVAEAATHFAPHYAEPAAVVATRSSTIHAAADDAAEQLGTLDEGDGFALLDVTGDWAWGYRLSDHLVGYVRDEALSAPNTATPSAQ